MSVWNKSALRQSTSATAASDFGSVIVISRDPTQLVRRLGSLQSICNRATSPRRAATASATATHGGISFIHAYPAAEREAATSPIIERRHPWRWVRHRAPSARNSNPVLQRRRREAAAPERRDLRDDRLRHSASIHATVRIGRRVCAAGRSVSEAERWPLTSGGDLDGGRSRLPSRQARNQINLHSGDESDGSAGGGGNNARANVNKVGTAVRRRRRLRPGGVPHARSYGYAVASANSINKTSTRPGITGHGRARAAARRRRSRPTAPILLRVWNAPSRSQNPSTARRAARAAGQTRWQFG